jgi:hypothetical protein
MKTVTGIVCVTVLCLVLCLNEAHGQATRSGGPGRPVGKRMPHPPVLAQSQDVIAAPLPAGTYTIGVGATFSTIDSAFSRLHADGIAGPVTLLLTDTLYVAPSTPGDFRLVGPIAGAGPASRITIRPADNVAVTITGSGTATLTFEDVSYLTLDGISLEGSTRMNVHTLVNTTYDWNDAVDLWGDCDHDTIQNLTAGSDRISNLWTSAVLLLTKDFSSPDSCVVSGVSITSGAIGILVGGYAPYAQRPTGNVIRGCHVGSPADSLVSQGIAAVGADGTIVENNHVDNLRLSLKEDPAGYPLVLGITPYFCRNTVIRNNVVHGLRGIDGASVQGIMASGDWGDAAVSGRDIQIYNNMVYDLQVNGTGGGYVGGIGVWRNDAVLVAYNTVRLEGTAPIGMGTHALAFDKGLTHATVRNNILVNLFQGGGNSALWADTSTTFTSDYNDLYIDTTVASSSTVARWPSPSYRLLTDWQATGQDMHSVSVMPPFVSPTDLHLLFTQTPLADAATPLPGITVDIDGDPRPTPGHSVPDMGADEFPHPTVGIAGVEGVPLAFALDQNYPNPFNPGTTIRYALPEMSHVTLTVFNALGQQVATLVEGEMEAGCHEVKFDASSLASGVYLYQLRAGAFMETRTLMILK